MTTQAEPRTAQRPRPSSADLVAGLVFIGFGLAFAAGALQHELGSLLEMGPGYFPLALAVLLVGLGATVVINAYVAPAQAEPDAEAPSGDVGGQGLSFGRIDWRPVTMIAAALLFFALTVDGLGLAPATFGTAVLATFAARDTTVRRAVAIAVALTLACYVIFVVLLQVQLPLLGEWVGG